MRRNNMWTLRRLAACLTALILALGMMPAFAAAESAADGIVRLLEREI